MNMSDSVLRAGIFTRNGVSVANAHTGFCPMKHVKDVKRTKVA